MTALQAAEAPPPSPPSPATNLEYLSEVVDFTPGEADVAAANAEPIHVILSCSEPLAECVVVPTTATKSDRIFRCHTLAAFVDATVAAAARGDDVDGGPPPSFAFEVRSIDLSPALMLNAYTYRCTVPTNVTIGGTRRIVIVAVWLPADDSDSDEPVCEGMAADVEDSLRRAWGEALASDPSSGGIDEVGRPALLLGGGRSSASESSEGGGSPASGGGLEARILTQLSEETFEFGGAPVAPGSESATAGAVAADTTPTWHSTSMLHDSSGVGEGSDCDFPVPAPTMAMIATALVDFPNPAADAVGNFTMAADGTIDDKDVALEATVTNVHEGGHQQLAVQKSTDLPGGMETAASVATAARQWATGPGLKSQSNTMGDEVDRHCKIGFVERLSSVIACAKNANAGGEDSTDDDDGPIHPELTAMEDDELDHILDGLLIRVVESLVEMRTSSYELQDELNASGASGFTLLHYTALYNLQSLCPLLFSRGASPDTPTARGRLTPLHLACAAGHWAIVELLVRNGCAVQVYDSFGSCPTDHARRNGFPEIAQWLAEKTGADRQKISEWRALDETRRGDFNAPVVGDTDHSSPEPPSDPV